MSDIISNLPGAILENILMCMPLRDAVRTSCLSRKWRYLWAEIPQLVFDDGIVTIVGGQDNLMTQNKILLTISQVLMLHPEPILKFTLSLLELGPCPGIDNLLAFLTGKGIEELTLQIWMGGYYKLPSSLLSWQKLTQLRLGCCNFTPPPTFRGFSRLVCLELCEVVISNDAFARLISTCPLLEQLRYESSLHRDLLEIDSGSLKISHFIGNIESISFKNTSHLATVSLLSNVHPIYFYGNFKSVSFDWFGFFTNLPALENLEMDEYYVKSLASSTVATTMPIANTSRTLESLRLYGISLDLPREIYAALCLISSPNLQKVTLEVKSNGQNVQGMEYLRRQFGTFVFDKLREIQLGITSGTVVELEFIKLILAKSRVLEKMVVKPDPVRVFDGGLRILKELTEFERASPRAKVMYKVLDLVDLVEAGGRKF